MNDKATPNMENPAPPPAHQDEFDLSTLETLGALSSRLIHDLKNKLAVIGGNAQFAEMLKNDPQRMAASMATIRRTTDEAGKFLEQMAALRRDLSTQLPPISVSAVSETICRAMREFSGWTYSASNAGSGYVLMPERWIAYSIWQLIRESRSNAGRVELSMREQSMETIPGIPDAFPTEAHVKIVLEYPLPSDRSNPVVCPSPMTIRSLAATELLRRTGASVQQDTTPSGVIIQISIPLVAKSTK